MRILSQEEVQMVSGAAFRSFVVNGPEGSYVQWQEDGPYRYGNEGQFTAVGWHNVSAGPGTEGAY